MQHIRALIAKIEPRDVCIVGGLLLLSVGVGMIYIPAAPICIGLTLFLIGIFGVPSWR